MRRHAKRSTTATICLVVALCVGLVLSASATAAPKLIDTFSCAEDSAGDPQSCAGETTWSPGRLAVNDATGDVYVIDAGSQVIRVFDEDGDYKSSISGPFSFFGLDDIAIDNSGTSTQGRVYVASGIEKFLAFDPSGTLSWEKFAQTGGLPIGIAVDASGDVLASEVFGGNVQHLAAATGEVIGSPIFTPAQVEDASNLVFDSAGNLYVRHFNESNVRRFSAALGYALPGDSYPGNDHTDIEIDRSNDRLYTVANGNQLRAFESDTSQLAGSPFGSGASGYAGVGVNSDSRRIFVSDAGSGTIEIWDLWTQLDVHTPGTGGGEVKCDTGSGPEACASEYPEGTEGTFTAVPDPGSTFVTFEDSTGSAVGCTDSPCTVTMGPDTELFAEFAQFHALTVKTAGSGSGAVTCDGGPCAPQYLGGTRILLAATPDSGSEFSGWSGGGCAGAGECRIRVKADVEVTATFTVASDSAGGPPASGPFPGEGFLPNDRAWEMVSPPDKNGGSVTPLSLRTRAAADGNAIGFISLSSFADNVGIGHALDYLSVRSTDPEPGTNGWSTHGVTPPQEPLTFVGVLTALEPLYHGEFSPDLRRGVFFARSALPTADPGADEQVAGVLNLYRRADLRTPGTGAYELLSACPHCEKTDTPLPALPGTPNDNLPFFLAPRLAGASTDLEHVAFESLYRLTTDTPTQPVDIFDQVRHLYEWQAGQVRLAGRIPTGEAIECGDAGAPACVAATVSLGGRGAEGSRHTNPHVISDGSSGPRRLFFTVPTDASGVPDTDATSGAGNLYVRTDSHFTAKLNASERAIADSFGPATYLDAAADGTLVVFKTDEALTDDAPANGLSKLYSYDTTKPASAPDNLTFLSLDGEPADGAAVDGVVGLSDDGDYVYFIAEGQLLAGEQLLAVPPFTQNQNRGIYLWHAGALRFIAPVRVSEEQPLLSSAQDVGLFPRQARVTPDGRHLIFGVGDGSSLLSRYGGTDHDHGACDGQLGKGCRELHLYSADSDHLVCVSCRPDGAPSATVTAGGQQLEGMSSLAVRAFTGDSSNALHETQALSDDGRYAFFSTAQKLLPTDTNGTTDAYVYDAATGAPHLLSSGEDASPSWFLDASADGSDAFIVTRERLSGWDTGSDYDLYDARIGGGFPEPPPTPPGCQGDACQPAPLALDDPTPGTATISGPGDRSQRKSPSRCRRGQRKVRRSGKARCVKRHRRTANKDRRVGR